jgi:hypothetical protein
MKKTAAAATGHKKCAASWLDLTHGTQHPINSQERASALRLACQIAEAVLGPSPMIADAKHRDVCSHHIHVSHVWRAR